MSQNIKKSIAILGFILGIALLVSACVSAAPESDQQPPGSQPRIVITQLITQIVATPTITPTPEPTEVPKVVLPMSISGWDPFSVPIYYPLQGCVASRLHEGDVAFVANGAGTLGIHYSKDTRESPIFRRLESGEAIDILKGPWCDSGFVIWKVASADGYIGFVPEGDGSVYWLLPMSPVTDPVLSKEELRIRQFARPGETLRIFSPNKAATCR
jgi:hypothetical protein